MGIYCDNAAKLRQRAKMSNDATEKLTYEICKKLFRVSLSSDSIFYYHFFLFKVILSSTAYNDLSVMYLSGKNSVVKQ